MDKVDFQRTAGGVIAVVEYTWNGLMKVGRKVLLSNTQRDFHSLSWKTYDCMLLRGCFLSVNLGGTAGDYNSSCPID